MADDVKIIDHSKDVEAAIERGIEKGLEMVGLKAEGYAKRLAPVDTGLLRNSITHALAGESFDHSYSASYGSNTYKNKKGETVRRKATSKNAGTVKKGEFHKQVGDKDEKAVYIGTNVEYAAYVEMGTSRTTPQPFLKPAATEHMKEYAKKVGACIKEAINN